MQSSHLIKLMISSANMATKAIMRDFGEAEKLQVSRKGIGNFFTSMDIKVEEIIKNHLIKHDKSYGFLMEESGEIPAGDSKDYYQWVIDPIDGTSNFIHGNPNFCISIGLRCVKNDVSELIAGVIAVPVYNQIYWAEKGKGAYLFDSNNINSRIKVSSHDEYEMLHFATCKHVSSNEYHNNLLQLCREKRIKLRISGSAALDLINVACGKVDLFFQNALNLWDIAAGLLIVTEAGGVIKGINPLDEIDLNAKKIGVIASNPYVIKKI